MIAHASTLTETVREHADVVFPAEAYAEKEGTLVHPDGRVQRLRPAIGRPGSLDAGVRPGWQVIAELATRCGLDLGVLAGPMASQQLFDAVPFYAGLSLDAIGGRGVRWPASRPPAALGAGTWELARLDVPPLDGTASNGTLRLGTWRSLWAAPEVDLSPALQFMRPRQLAELSPADADRLGVRDGDQVELGSNGARVRAAARLRASIPGGSVFLVEGTRRRAREPARRAAGRGPPRRRRRRSSRQPSAAAVLTPAGEGHAEAPASAPLIIPPTERRPS